MGIQEDVASRRGRVGSGHALDQERRLRRRVEAWPDRGVQGADEEEIAAAEADVDRRDLGMSSQGPGEERERLEARGEGAGPRERVSREDVDHEAGRREQVSNLSRRVLRDVAELLVTRREQETRGGAVAVADDGEAGRGDEGDEQRRDVHAKREPPPPRTRRLEGGTGHESGPLPSDRSPTIEAGLRTLVGRECPQLYAGAPGLGKHGAANPARATVRRERPGGSVPPPRPGPG